jgi:hypothetical protein
MNVRHALAIWTVVMVALGITASAQAPSWHSEQFTDALHGVSGVTFTLSGDYLTAPRLPANGFRPTLVVKCSGGKVKENYISFGAVLNAQAGRLYPVMMESRLDGKKGTIGADDLSTDGMSAYFSRSELRNILKSRKVIVGADEYLGPEIVVQFDLPDSSQLMQACGSDRMLKGL